MLGVSQDLWIYHHNVKQISHSNISLTTVILKVILNVSEFIALVYLRRSLFNRPNVTTTVTSRFFVTFIKFFFCYFIFRLLNMSRIWAITYTRVSWKVLSLTWKQFFPIKRNYIFRHSIPLNGCVYSRDALIPFNLSK